MKKRFSEEQIIRILKEHDYNTFKAKLINRFNFRTDEEFTHAISEYAYVWYNQVRPHSYNDYRTPYEARYGLA